MRKTADLTVVQKTTTDTLHKEGKTQKSSVSKHINREAKGRKRCGRKKCTSNRDNRTLERINHYTQTRRQKRLAWAKDKKDWTAAEWSKVMERGEAQNPRCLRSKVNAAVYQDVLEHFMLPAADQLYGDTDFIFQQDLSPAHSAKATSTWFKDHGIPVLNWPANSPDLNPTENLWGIVKRKMRYARPNNAEELKATIRATCALITPEQCHRLIDSMPRRIAAVIPAKGAPTKY
ncbi:hypothetical protein M9458_008004 [Cirrhinus mrigala]|uniref:Tc1-like transposase DDE domain-containing protein n=1 Tax=Cirrhinus mrigala TaxID=683832 RepID=A0ABD0RLZ1_CIRMR